MIVAGNNDNNSERSREELRALQEQYEEEENTVKPKGQLSGVEISKKRIAQKRKVKKEAKKITETKKEVKIDQKTSKDKKIEEHQNSGYKSIPKKRGRKLSSEKNKENKENEKKKNIKDDLTKESKKTDKTKKIEKTAKKQKIAKTTKSEKVEEIGITEKLENIYKSPNEEQDNNKTDVQKLVNMIKNGEKPKEQKNSKIKNYKQKKSNNTIFIKTPDRTKLKLSQSRLNLKKQKKFTMSQKMVENVSNNNQNQDNNTQNTNISTRKTKRKSPTLYRKINPNRHIRQRIILPIVPINKSNTNNVPQNKDTTIPDINLDLGNISTTQNNQRTNKTNTSENNTYSEKIQNGIPNQGTEKMAVQQSMIHNRQTAQNIVDGADRISDRAERTGRTLNNASRVAAANAAKNAASKSKKAFLGKTKLKALSFIAKFGIVGTIIGIIVFILMIIGALSFFMNMPGMVIDGIKDWIDDISTEIKGYVLGKDIVDEKKVKQLATNLYNLRNRFGILGICINISFR